MDSSWEARDLPVLAAIVALTDEGARHIEKPSITARTGLDAESVDVALFALAAENPPFFAWSDVSNMTRRQIDFIREPTGHARRAVGAWPTPEAWADQMTQALAEAADKESNPEKKSKLRQAAEVVGGIGREVIIRTATGTISGGM